MTKLLKNKTIIKVKKLYGHKLKDKFKGQLNRCNYQNKLRVRLQINNKVKIIKAYIYKTKCHN